MKGAKMESTLEMLKAFAVELKEESLDARRARIEEVEREIQEIESLAVPVATPCLDFEELEWIGYSSLPVRGTERHNFGMVKIVASRRPGDDFFSVLASSPPEFGPQENFLLTATKDVAVSVFEVA